MMKHLPKKIHFTADGRSFILFMGKPAMLAEVFSFDAAELLIHYKNKLSDELQAAKMPEVAAATTHHSMYYLFVAVRFFEPIEVENQVQANKLARNIRYLADWYRYTVLKADAN